MVHSERGLSDERLAYIGNVGLSGRTVMNTVSGRVVVKESGVGVPDLLVVLFSLAPDVPTKPAQNGAATDFRVSVVTNGDGAFEVTYDDADLGLVTPPETRPNLQINVLAPEEPGVAPESQLLYSSAVPREHAGRTENYIVWLTAAQLQKAGISGPSEISADLEPAPNVVGRLTALATRQSRIVDGAVAAAKQLVDAHRVRAAGFDRSFRPALLSAVSKLPASPLNPERFVGPDDSVQGKAVAVTQAAIAGTINSDDQAVRAPARGFVSLTAAQLLDLKAQADAGGVVPSAALATIAAANGGTGRTTYVQAVDRLPLCRPSTPSVDCANSLLDPSPLSNDPTPPPGNGETTITGADLARYLGRLMEPLTAPEEQLVVGLMPVASRDSVQSSIQSFAFDPSPADVPAFHDFNSLQIAFEYVWQEAIDQGALDLAQNAYETIVELGGTPDHPDYKGVHPVRALVAEGNLVLKANATPTVIVRDHRGEPPGTRLPPPAGEPVTTGLAGSGCEFASSPNVRDHRTGDPAAIDDPVTRLPALLEALNRKLLENYSFTVYGANAQERSVNFGILNTYRQLWTPLSYQAGPLVQSVPLAPKQTQKLVITRKTTKKRSTKELENNLRVLKEETSQTNRAEQDITDKASRSTDFSFSNTATGDMKVGSDTTTTTFKQDAAKSSDDIKKSFHEAVFKSAQEFKQEKTTEINTEETSDYESVETTEISNPNDEIAVTYLFYELQRRYRLFERLYRVEPVVLVAQEFPRPEDIDDAWLVRYDWILRRAILDDSFLPVLANLAQTAGDEIALEEMRTNVNQQRCIVNELRQELAIASQQATAQRALMDQVVYHRSGASSLGGILGGVESVVGDVAGAVEKVGEFVLGGAADQNDSNRQALQERADAAADQVRDLMFRLEREVTALNALTETYTKALRDHNNHLTEIARLRVHVKDNIMYYMQAIWIHEPPDQRYFRLHNTPVPDLTPTTQAYRLNFDGALATTVAPPHQSLPRFGGRDAKLFPLESVTKFDTQLTFKPLSQVADLDRLLGFKGNYAIFPLLESNALTDFMMDPYVDRATGQLLDPSDPVNWSLDEFCEYVCCLKKNLTDEEFQTLRAQLQALYQTILSNPLRDDDVLVVPTNSLFIEALPGTHTLLERFKLDHRMIDVKKAQSEVRREELDNVRMTARILAGEHGDPHVDKKILIEVGANFVVPVGDQ
jgi:hypothetical protein